MSDHKSVSSAQDEERINIHEESELRAWSEKLNATPEQLKEAVAAAGNLASDVEMHLKGSRSSSNSERVHNAL